MLDRGAESLSQDPPWLPDTLRLVCVEHTVFRPALCRAQESVVCEGCGTSPEGLNADFVVKCDSLRSIKIVVSTRQRDLGRPGAGRAPFRTLVEHHLPPAVPQYPY